MIDEILAYNKRFVEEKGYEPYVTTKYPDKKLAILTCMDTRLTELLPKALGLKNGDAKIIKNAGGVILDPFGTEIRSILVAIYELHADTVMVIHHTNCGACHMSGDAMIHHMLDHGIDPKSIKIARLCGVDFDKWLYGFGDTEKSVVDTARIIKNHPLVPADITVRAFIIDSVTGLLTEVPFNP
ncbi:MAG: carbonic anhydrase [Bacteroidales bacterium]|nr:carbonic anhydrase [Bacteroidales bacterium]